MRNHGHTCARLHFESTKELNCVRLTNSHRRKIQLAPDNLQPPEHRRFPRLTEGVGSCLSSSARGGMCGAEREQLRKQLTGDTQPRPAVPQQLE